MFDAKSPAPITCCRRVRLAALYQLSWRRPSRRFITTPKANCSRQFGRVRIFLTVWLASNQTKASNVQGFHDLNLDYLSIVAKAHSYLYDEI